MATNQPIVYVGTYTEAIKFGTGEIFQGKGEGIYAFRMDAATGGLEPLGVARGVQNPSYVCVSPDRRYLYAVNELKEFEGQASGSVSAFAVDPASESLTFLNRRATRGTDPCHIAIDRTGRHVMVANFMSGSVSVFPVESDGRLGEASDFVQHRGSSVDRARQSGPHAHACVLDEANRALFVPDLGIDTLVVYGFDAEHGKLTARADRSVKVKPGAGPRHVAFRPDGRFAYLINELDSTVNAYSYEAASATLREIQSVSTLPPDFRGKSTCADIAVTQSGRFLYASNRGHDSIVAFRIHAETGRLSYVAHQSTGGKVPRSFAIDPSGNFLFAANQSSDTLVAFRIDLRTGMLQPTGQVTNVPSPVCVRIFE